MRLPIRHQRCASWIAIFAILMSVLAPTISRALATAKGEENSGWVEICTAAGIQWVAIASDGTSEILPPLAKFTQKYCPYCAPYAGSVGLLPIQDFAVNLLTQQNTPPVFFHLAEHFSSTKCSPPHPRAPPMA